MKKLATICLFCFVLASLSAQVEYRNFGTDGLVIELNANYEMDVNEDGIIDFYVNQQAGEIGFDPIFAVGCFTSDSEGAYTTFGARQLSTHEEGAMIYLDNANMWDYIDEDRGSIWNDDGVFDEGWEDGSIHYVGFAVFAPLGTLDGWMQIKLDAENKTMVIYDLAYKVQDASFTGILAGEGKVTSVNNLDEVISSMKVGPIPANQTLNVSFNYLSQAGLSCELIAVDGRKVYQHPIEMGSGQQQFEIDLDEYPAGNYLLRLISTEGVFTKQLSLVK